MIITRWSHKNHPLQCQQLMQQIHQIILLLLMSLLCCLHHGQAILIRSPSDGNNFYAILIKCRLCYHTLHVIWIIINEQHWCWVRHDTLWSHDDSIRTIKFHDDPIRNIKSCYNPIRTIKSYDDPERTIKLYDDTARTIKSYDDHIRIIKLCKIP